MLYCRRFKGNQASSEFDRLIGKTYREKEDGLSTAELPIVYCQKLGMKEANIASQGDLHFIVAAYGPTIVTVGGGDSAHSMVMAGYDLLQGRWLLLDPAAGETMTFAEEEITANRPGSPGERPKPVPKESPTRLTDFRTGPATWKNMSRWVWILETTVHELVYYYAT